MAWIGYIEKINEWVGKISSWSVFILTLVVGYDVVMRYIFSDPTEWAYDISYMLYSFYFLMGAGYTQLEKGHVRVDLLLMRYSAKKKAIWDICFSLFIIFPFLATVFYYSVDFAIQSWKLGETSPLSVFQPPVYPLKTVLPVAFFLLIIQCIADFTGNLRTVMRGGGHES